MSDTAPRRPWKQHPSALAALFLFTVSPRAVLLAVIPLEALARLGDARSVSLMYLLASVFGVLGSLSIPTLIRWGTCYRVFHLAGLSAVLAGILLYQAPLALFLAGMVAWVFSAVAFEVTMNLYVMEHIPRAALTRFEPRRILFAVVGYSLGPWLGVYLSTTVGVWVPYALTGTIALLALAYFRYLGLRDTTTARTPGWALNPMGQIQRFYAQPRLRLAWLITFARTAWWSTFFIYTPIYVVQLGMSESDGGALVSVAVAMVYTVTLWARLGRRYGFRLLAIGGFAATGLVSLLIPFAQAPFALSDVATNPAAIAALLLFAALCVASLDGLGHVAFLRAVRPLEREAMSGVYATYRDAAQLLPPAIFALVLLLAPLPAVYATAGLWMLITAWYCRHLPRRLK